MRVFVTGASGFIGSAVLPELIDAGHEVVGLARSEASAQAVKALGAEVRRGDLSDLDGLREAAAEAEAVIHLAFDHAAIPAGRFAEAAAADVAVVQAIGGALVGTGKTLIGIGLKPTGDPQHDAVIAASPRSAVSRALSEFTDRGVRTIHMAIPSVTHGHGDHGFVPTLIRLARATGVSAYVGEGANTWPAGHVLDVAHLYALALDKAPAGAQLYAATEPAIPVRTIAEAIARHLGIEPVSLTPEQAAEHFKPFPFITINVAMPNAETRALLDWHPTHPTLFADLDEGHYFAEA
jgi:nucleoside-diphosphate-sugar epimerase